jgi:excinuclease UvrABC nuclease subunit
MGFNNSQTYNFVTTDWYEVPAVYGIFNANMQIIYIGQTDNLRRRMNEHKANSSHLMHRYRPAFVLVEMIYNEQERCNRERQLINAYQPPCNLC